jgi:hypothetical protein
VIVFTHSMAVLLRLDEPCRATKDREATSVGYRLISRSAENVGYCRQNAPASIMPLDKVIDRMKAHLANVKIRHERGDQAKWLREVTSFQDQLRNIWERAVEEVLKPVIRRLSRKVDTTGLIISCVAFIIVTMSVSEIYICKFRCLALRHPGATCESLQPCNAKSVRLIGTSPQPACTGVRSGKHTLQRPVL